MSLRPRAGVAAAALPGADDKSPSTDIVAKLFANLNVAGPDTEGKRNRGEYEYGDLPESDNDDDSVPFYKDEFFRDGAQMGGGDGYVDRPNEPKYATFEYDQRRFLQGSETPEEKEKRQKEELYKLFEEYQAKEMRGSDPGSSGNPGSSGDPSN
jgi:hypothetical protein